MNYTLRQLRYFVATAEHGNVSAASRSLFVSQPAVSSAIAQLEEVFGVQLLLRQHARGVSLTPAGRRLLAEARGLLAHAEELGAGIEALGNSPAGELDLGCFVTLAPFYLPGLLRDFRDAQPGIRVQIREGALDTLVQWLTSGECEIALMYDLGLGEQIEHELLARIRPYVLLPRDHRLAGAGSVCLHELAGEPMIMLNLPHSREYFRSLFARAGVEPVIRLRTMSFELVRGLVANGHGFSILNLRPADDITYDGARLSAVALAGEVEPLSVVLAHARGARPTRRVEQFAEHCRRWFAAHADGQDTG